MARSADPLQLSVPDAAGAPTAARRRAAALSWQRLRRSSNLAVGAVIVTAVVASALLAPGLAPYDPIDQEFTSQLRPPSAAHLFGTDEFGRDIFSRVLFGARIALNVGIVADLIATVLGVLLGVVAGYIGGRLDALVTRVLDVMLAFPYLLLAMIVVAILGPGLTNAMIAIALVYTPQFARVVRGVVLSVKEQEFVDAARAIGAGGPRILARCILPNIVSPIIVMATLTVGFMIVETAGLSFLGLGASPPTPEWGSMLATGRSYMLSAPWIATFPGLAILVTVVAFNLVGDGLRDLLDPRLRGRL
jgi:peptide/nickel transport system permease protein